MKHALRAALATALAATALAAAVPSALAAPAQSPVPACRAVPANAAAPASRAASNPTTISAAHYNQARNILAHAGSMNAAKSHLAHGVRNVPVRYGTQLLACSRDEFRHKDRDAPLKRSGMTPYHWLAIHDAAKSMGINRW
ncbi:hypothetical protein ACGH2B_27965 [Streptomyces sp. BBFR2]|uniref:hypothetical protein n=1 Tax=Streptomyces sp. BBFR2 TaxID=3372854 RepID=UPI0037DA218D